MQYIRQAVQCKLNEQKKGRMNDIVVVIYGGSVWKTVFFFNSLFSKAKIFWLAKSFPNFIRLLSCTVYVFSR